MSPIIPIFVLLFIGGVISESSELVPAFIWHTIPTKGLVSAMAHVNQDTFKEILLQKQSLQGSNRIIVFAEQNLSPEDLSDRNTFVELSKLAKKPSITYLPTVVSPVDGIKAFAPHIKSVSIDDVNDDGSILESQQLIINLNDAQENEDRVVMLKRHSKFISEVYEKITANGEESNVLAIYTGYHSSWIVPNAIRNLKRERRATKDQRTVEKLPHFLVYSDGVFVHVDDQQKSENLTVTGISESNNELVITTSGGPVKLIHKVDNYQNWIVEQITYNGKQLDGSFFTPLGFSYSCSSGLTYRVKQESKFLTFPTFQIQFFVNGTPTNPEFYDSYDCIGFTSIPIWSGLFVSFLLVIILSIGLTMIMDIKTMDRFDDPKGKTIIINAE